MDPQHIIEAEKNWRFGRLGVVGYLLYENLPVNKRPGWAVGVLQLCCSVADQVPHELKSLIDLSHDPSSWKEAKPAFRAVRLLTLSAFRAEPEAESLHSRLLYLAESTAKVIYNASGEEGPFDSDAGWWIPQRAVELVQKAGDHLYPHLWEALIWPWHT
jgi:hypothetical protein